MVTVVVVVMVTVRITIPKIQLYSLTHQIRLLQNLLIKK